MLLSVIHNPKRQGVPQSPMLFLPSRGKPYLRGEGCPLTYRRSPTRPLCGLSYRSEHLTSPSSVQPNRDPIPCVGACREGWFHAQTPYITKSTPCTTRIPQTNLTAPWIPLVKRSVHTPSHHAASTDHMHRLAPPRLTITAGKCFPPHEPYLFLAADPRRASANVPGCVCFASRLHQHRRL